MPIDVKSTRLPVDRTLCPGSSRPIPSESVNMNGQTAVIHTAICPDCAQWVDVWLSGPVGQPGQWIRDPHSEPIGAGNLTAIR
jgi:hypothetical protein